LGLPERCHEWSFSVGPVVFPYHFTNRYRSLSGVVKGYYTYKVMTDVSLNNVVEQVFVNETKISINGCSGASHEFPCAISVMRQRAIRVMKESDGS
jgi:hypothetical protein